MTAPRSHWPECLSLRPEPVYDDGTPNPCDCRTLSRIKLQDNPEMGDRLLAAVDESPQDVTYQEAILDGADPMEGFYDD